MSDGIMSTTSSTGLGEVASSHLLGLIGENVAGSLTPLMHEAEARRQGIPLVYRPLDPNVMRSLKPGAMGSTDAGAPRHTEVDWPRLVTQALDFGYTGFNVTHPAKQLVQAALDDLDDDAALLGAVNTITLSHGRLVGRNTDHRGFNEALSSLGVDPAAGEVLQIGAGGAGAAVAYALLNAGVPQLSIADIDLDSTETLKARLSRAFAGDRIRLISPDQLSDDARDAAGVVNCTPIGMTGFSDDSPFPLESLRSEMWVGDAIYRPRRTTLIKAAHELGCVAFGGSRMAVGQAAAAFTMFTGAPADRKFMLSSFEEHG